MNKPNRELLTWSWSSRGIGQPPPAIGGDSGSGYMTTPEERIKRSQQAMRDVERERCDELVEARRARVIMEPYNDRSIGDGIVALPIWEEHVERRAAAIKTEFEKRIVGVEQPPEIKPIKPVRKFTVED